MTLTDWKQFDSSNMAYLLFYQTAIQVCIYGLRISLRRGSRLYLIIYCPLIPRTLNCKSSLYLESITFRFK